MLFCIRLCNDDALVSPCFTCSKASTPLYIYGMYKQQTFQIFRPRRRYHFFATIMCAACSTDIRVHTTDRIVNPLKRQDMCGLKPLPNISKEYTISPVKHVSSA